MKKLFKKSIACLIAVLMIITSLPLTAITAQAAVNGTLTQDGYQILVSGSQSRWSNGQFNIVNDQQENNTSAGIIRFDISQIKNLAVNSATLNYKIDSKLDDYQGLTFYWSTDSARVNDYIQNGESTRVNITCGSDTTANESWASLLGFTTSQVLGTVAKSNTSISEQTMDIKSGFQNALNTGASYLYLVITQTNAGDNGGNGSGGDGTNWTDTKLTPTKFSITYDVGSTFEQLQSLYNSMGTPTVKSGNATTSADGTFKKADLRGDDAMENVLYLYGFGDSNYTNGSARGCTAGVEYGDITFLDDGVNTMAAPIMTYYYQAVVGIMKYPLQPRNTKITKSSEDPFYLNHLWHGKMTWDNTYIADTTYYINYGQYSDNYYRDNLSNDILLQFNNDGCLRLSNSLYVDRDLLNYSNSYLYEDNSQRYDFYYYLNSNEPYTAYCNHNKSNIRVIKYSDIANIIRAVQNSTLAEYNNIKSNIKYYTLDTTYTYLAALKALCDFDPNTYFANNTNGYAACASRIGALLTEYEAARNALELSPNFVFKDKNGSVVKEIRCYNYAEAYAERPANTADVATNNNNGSHGLYSYAWPQTPDRYNVFQEQQSWSNAFCSYGDKTTEVTKEPTCTEAGEKKVTEKCKVCGYVKTTTEAIEPNGHSYGEETSEVTTEPTCDQTGLRTYYKECSVCKEKLITRTEEIPATGEHNYGQEVASIEKYPTCTETGVAVWTKTCKVCGHQEERKVTINAKGHTYVYTPATMYKHTVTCEKDDLEAYEADHNFVDGVCADCGFIELDESAYNAAAAELEAELAKTDVYTAESIAAARNALDTAQAAKANCMTQDALDVLTQQIKEAKESLAYLGFEVTFVIDKDGVTTETKAFYDYGTVINLDANTDKVIKWTVEAQDGTTNLGTTAQAIDYVVARNAIVTVYVTDDADMETQQYSKVTFIGHNDTVVAVKYVKAGETLATSDVAVPVISFYNTAGWDKASVTGTGSDITVRAKYTAQGTEKCNVVFGDFQKNYDYDTLVYLADADEDGLYAMYDADDNLLTYFVGKEFYAPHTDMVVIKAAESAQASSAITGFYQVGTKLVYNSKFYLPEDKQLIKAGVEVTVGDKTVKFYADKVSARNEFSYAIDFGSLTGVEVKARSFVEYMDGGEQKIAYSNTTMTQNI